MLKNYFRTALIAFPFLSFAQDGTLDMSFNATIHPTAPEYNGFGYGSTLDGIYSILKLQSGKLLIYGDFSEYQGGEVHHLAIIDGYGALDTSFNVSTGLGDNDTSYAHPQLLAQQPDGKVIIAGGFSTFNGTGHKRIVRLNLDGSIDESFNPGTAANGLIEAIALQPDGKILCAGNFSAFNGQEVNGMVRLNTDGSRDTTFNIGQGFILDTTFNSTGEVQTLALQGDGKIVVGGRFMAFNGVAKINLVRLNADGSQDTTFNIGIGAGRSSQNSYNLGSVSRVLFDPATAKIYICGIINYFNNEASYNVKRLNANGTVDATFNFTTGIGPNGLNFSDGYLNEMLLLQDGRLAVGGEFETGTCKNLALFNPDGTLDTSFSTQIIGNYDKVNSLAEIGEGIFVAGDFEAVNSYYNKKGHIVKLRYSGKTDIAFNPNLGSNANEGFCFGGFGLNDDTILLTSLHSGSWPYDIDAALYNERPSPATIHINTDGSIHTQDYDNFIVSGITGKIFSYGNDGEIIVSDGFFTKKMSVNGIADAGFSTQAIIAPEEVNVNVFTYAHAVQPDGKIIVAGNFRYDFSYSPVRQRIMRVNANGSLDATFNVGKGFNGDMVAGTEGYQVNVLQLQQDGKILVAGSFTNYYATETLVGNIARLNTDGSLDTTFEQGTGFNDEVWGMVYQQDGKIIVIGAFTSYNGIAVNYIARLNSNGSLDTSFAAPYDQSYPNSRLLNLIMQPDGKYIVHGRYGGNVVINRLNHDGTLDTTFFNENYIQPFENYGTDLKISQVVLLHDQRILLTGTFTEINNVRRVGVAVLKNTPTTLSVNLPQEAADVQTVRVAPNPVGNMLNIYTGSTLHEASVYAIDGRLIKTIQFKDNRADVSALQPGIYLVKIIDNGKVQMVKIIKH